MFSFLYFVTEEKEALEAGRQIVINPAVGLGGTVGLTVVNAV